MKDIVYFVILPLNNLFVNSLGPITVVLLWMCFGKFTTAQLKMIFLMLFVCFIAIAVVTDTAYILFKMSLLIHRNIC